MPSWVRTVSLYVDEVGSPQEASVRVQVANEVLDNYRMQIVEPDKDSDYQWEESGTDV